VDELLAPPEELRRAADEFAGARDDLQATLERLERVAQGLETRWNGLTRQAFYKHYLDWRDNMRSNSAFLGLIARELRATAQRLERLDQ
jgi:WXG100 family type VII secretion target